MLFNSFSFLFFLIVVSTSYFLLPHRFRWALLLIASCYFYMCFVPIYILILFFTILVDYFVGIWLEDTVNPKKRLVLLYASILTVVLTLFVFKYFNFFNENVAQVASLLHWNYPIEAMKLILPIGLSFHTFQSLSYVIEVYYGRQKAERHFGIYALYVMYFPQLVAGPIERPQNLLQQFHEKKQYDNARVGDGLHLALWGLFKKVVVADSLALYVDAVYNSVPHHSSLTLLVATYLFAFQIYSDFSGYSDIARGVSRIYGIELMKNFETPYFSTSINEFWSRWHISLSSWFRDYLYIPLGGNRVSESKRQRNIFTVFLVSGLWHGANWTYVVWGALHGLFANLETKLFPFLHKNNFGKLRVVLGWFITFHLVVFAWIFFRAKDLTTALDVIKRIASAKGPFFFDVALVPAVLSLIALVLLDLFHRKTDYWSHTRSYSLVSKYAYVFLLIFTIILFGVDRGSQFIYFQF